MIRALPILLLVTACAHQPRREPVGHYAELPPLPRSAFMAAELPDEGSGGGIPDIPFYLVREGVETQAMAPVGSPSWLGQAYSMTLSAPQGAAGASCLVEGGSGTSGVCLGGYPGVNNNALYIGITPSARTTSNYVLRGDGTNAIVSAPSANVQFRVGDALQWNLSTSALYPQSNNAEDLGTSAARVKTGYFVGLNVSGTTSNGTITLSGGTGTATVTSGANCVCSDTTSAAAVKCAVASTTLTATGTGTDVIAYHCF